MCFMCLCNLNARFTSIFLKITLIPHLLMFCRIRRRIKQSEGRNQVKRKWLSYNSLLRQGEGKASPRRGGSPRKRKGFAATRPKRAKKRPRVHQGKEASSSPRRRRLCLCEDSFCLCRGKHILRRGERRIDHKTTLEFAKAKKPLPRRSTLGRSSKLCIFSPSLAHFPLPINICI